jgi:phosphate starvation-inducible PhoH-like protein
VIVPRREFLSRIFGDFDRNALLISRALSVSMLERDGEIVITAPNPDNSDNVDKAARVINGMISILNNGEEPTEQSIRYLLSVSEDAGEIEKADKLGAESVCITASGKPIRPKTLGQKRYVDSIRKHTITFAVGPAGTGKSYLAVALAVRAMKAKEVQRIILTRPAVEAGEKLGFLPGDLQNKIDPYLRPLNDALFDMLGAESLAKQIERGAIEVAPLAYMRGRTLDDSFIILDEAQNTTNEQMKMFLTRLGTNSRMVINGDVTQIDLPADKKSGLVEAVRILKNIDDIAICKFTEKDVVRHRLVQDIVRAYEKAYDKTGTARKHT